MSFNDQLEELREEYEERFELIRERVAEIAETGEKAKVGEKAKAGEKAETGEIQIPETYESYFRQVGSFLSLVYKAYDLMEQETEVPLETLKSMHDGLYANMQQESYEHSFLNPSYATKVMSKELGQLLGALYADLYSLVPAAYERRLDLLCIWSELFVQIYGNFVEELQEMGATEVFSEDSIKWIEGNVKDSMYWFYHDYQEIFVPDVTTAMLLPEYDFFYHIIMEADLSKDDYLYQYGSPIGENELAMAAYLRTKSQDEIEKMAATYTEGFRKGFEVTGRDISKKKTVRIEAPIGFEAVVRAAILQFEEMGLRVTMSREAVASFQGRGGGKRGIYATSLNKQFDFDHKEDRSIYFDKSFVERRLEILRDTFEKNKEAAATYGGPAVIEVFGEEPFSPEMKEERLVYSKKQEGLNVYHASESGKITNTFIPGDEYSFTIIAFPVPAIGKQFEEIFDKTVELNTLDYELYLEVQQKIIDVLDQGYGVHITGRGDNRTDMTVMLHPLKDATKETIFENCVADVNIPVGEVFTSPKLEGTNGLLHVTQVYLGELCYKNLEITFQDGMIVDYHCSNFEDDAEGKDYIASNVLHHHASLPMGEFAIGTNTVAYQMARTYDIADKLPILIAEKTGPHFAVGDTCYSHAEDMAVYNQNGKEIIARDNSVSLLRKEDETKAYFNCHTDITIPYDELGDIEVLCEDGRVLPVITNGRFVVEGSEVLNEALEQ